MVIVDDSVVRGTTLEFLVQEIQQYYEPCEIHIRIPSPQIIGPCYYAINLKHPGELVTRKFFDDPKQPTLEELDILASHFRSESIRYLPVDEMMSALRVMSDDMCTGCVSGDYPTKKGQEIFQIQLRELQKELKACVPSSV